MKFKRVKIIFFTFLTLFGFLGTSLADTDMKENQTDDGGNLFEGFVYYADKQKTALKPVKKRFSSTLESHELGLEIIKTMIAGPSDTHLEAIWPRDTKINSFFITDGGKAYIDISPGSEMGKKMDTGSELLAIYSMVNSLTLNIPKIKMVKILIDGTDAVTLAGHIDLEYFYKTNMLIVSRRSHVTKRSHVK